MKSENVNKEFKKILDTYIDNTLNELRIIWNNLSIDLTRKEMYEVLGGLIARQITIAKQFLSCSSIWTEDIAPIILRSMADNYINFAWILNDPLDRSRKFILHGLGQEKLVIEHRKKELENEGINYKDDEFIKACERWIDTQRYSFLTEVNIGSWSGLSTRDMAEQSGCMDFYNYVYLPFSCAAHNLWNHIAKYNLIISENPLHNYLRRPVIPDNYNALIYVDLAAKYVDKMLCEFDTVFKDQPKRKSSYKILKNSFIKLNKKIEKGSDNNTANGGQSKLLITAFQG
jgi:hypothetical protein